jgi:hypothetical protein
MGAKIPEPSYYHLIGALQERGTVLLAAEFYGVSVSTVKLWMLKNGIRHCDYIDQIGEDGRRFVEYLIAREEQESDDATST